MKGELSKKMYATFDLGLSAALLPSNFNKRRTGLYVRSSEEVTQIVQIQSSSSSTSSILKLTVNIGLSSRLLSEALPSSYPPTTEISCQARTRISSFLGTRHNDIWWTISDEVTANGASSEVSKLLSEFVIPAMNNLETSEAVLRAWKEPIPPPPGLLAGGELRQFFIESLEAALAERRSAL